MHNSFSIFIALLKRELLEHKNLWRVPFVLLVIAVLLKLSFVFGNLSIEIDFSAIKPLDDTIDSVFDSAIFKALSFMNFFVMVIMFIVAIFYALSCLYEERRDDSVLFWRSLPISDSITVLSKLFIPLVIVPLIIVVCQALNSVIFLSVNATTYLNGAFLGLSLALLKKILWSLLPMIAWCLFCSVIAKKTPFLLAFVTPIILVLVDNLFLNGEVSEAFIINRVTGVSQFSMPALLSGVIFSVVCIAGVIFKRAQKI